MKGKSDIITSGKVNRSIAKDNLAATSKSFRSKMFEKRSLKATPKINNRQISLHSPRYEDYLSADLHIYNNQVPQIWGCIIPETRKTQSVRKNYLKRDINTPENIYTSYLKRKNNLIFDIPYTRQFIQTKMDKNKQDQKAEEIYPSNPQQNLSNPEQNMSHFFTQVIPASKTTRQKIKRYQDEDHQEIKSSKLLLTKSRNFLFHSRFGEKLTKKQGVQRNRQREIRNNKSIYEMSLQQLKQSIKWKRQFLECLNQSMIQVKERRV